VLATLHGHTDLALLLQEGPDLPCPECGEYIEFGDAEQLYHEGREGHEA